VSRWAQRREQLTPLRLEWEQRGRGPASPPH